MFCPQTTTKCQARKHLYHFEQLGIVMSRPEIKHTIKTNDIPSQSRYENVIEPVTLYPWLFRQYILTDTENEFFQRWFWQIKKLYIWKQVPKISQTYNIQNHYKENNSKDIKLSCERNVVIQDLSIHNTPYEGKMATGQGKYLLISLLSSH